MGLQVVIIQEEDKWAKYLQTRMENVETWILDESIDVNEVHHEWRIYVAKTKALEGKVKLKSFAEYLRIDCGAELLPFVEYER